MLLVDVLAYSKDAVLEENGVTLARAKELVADPTYPNVWINCLNLTEEGSKELEETFGIHPLALEDARIAGQRAKVEDYENHHYIVLHSLRLRRIAEAVNGEPIEELTLANEQINLFFAKNWVFTAHRTPRDELESVRKRIRDGRRRIRTSGPDYLAYAILDAVVDGYFPVIEQLREEAEELEDSALADPRREILARVYALRRVTVEFRRRLWPARDMVGALLKMEGTGFQKKTQPFLRDVYDHLIVILEFSEGVRESSQAILEVYLSSLSNRTNEVVKVLTVITVLFVPLTLVASLWGMNVPLPLENSSSAFALITGTMVALVTGFLVAFRRRGWL